VIKQIESDPIKFSGLYIAGRGRERKRNARLVWEHSGQNDGDGFEKIPGGKKKI